MKFDALPTPAYVIDEARLTANLEILRGVEKRTGCKILLAQKAFSAFALYPLIRRYITGTTSSGLFEARLGHEEFGGEVHVYSPAYKRDDFWEIIKICDHISFNSLAQLELHRPVWEGAGRSVGLRVNPEFSTQKGAIYDPCAPGSRLGVTEASFPSELPEGVEGLHFHTLCEQGSDDLARTFEIFERKFGRFFRRLKWLNLGGGHHITREGYDIAALQELICRIHSDYGVEVYLEPGEAIALDAGYLICEVLDIVDNGIKTLILDTSAVCHMPDVLEMPYRPPLRGGYEPGEKPYTYRLSSCTCLAGDIIGDWSFEREMRVGDRLCFSDMAIYTMVKNNTFNGMPLPTIVLMRQGGECEIIKSFSYSDFKGRLS